jgi:hypothetical protein
MAFSRALQPRAAPEGDAVTAAMVGIGMSFAAPAAVEPNIEDTLLWAAVEAMDRDDLRVAAVLSTWVGVHAPWVNADRLTKLVATQQSVRVQGAVGGAGAVAVQGSPVRAACPLRVPANLLRDRPADVLSPIELARRHRAYRCRVLIGPSYRADMWAALEGDPTLTAAALARRTYGSFATAWHTKQSYAILAVGLR